MTNSMILCVFLIFALYVTLGLNLAFAREATLKASQNLIEARELVYVEMPRDLVQGLDLYPGDSFIYDGSRLLMQVPNHTVVSHTQECNSWC